jgi:hypothetical protein
MLPWPSGRGGRMVQTTVSWMNVYPGFLAKEDEQEVLPLWAMKKTLLM